MGATMSNKPHAADSQMAALASRQAKKTLRAFYRIGREATELGCRFDLLPGSPIVAEALKLILEREADRDCWRHSGDTTFTPADIALGMIDTSLYGKGIAQDAISGDLTLASLVTDYQWGIVCGMVIAGRYLDRDYGEVSTVVTDSAQTVVQRRRHPSWWGDIEVRAFSTSMYRQATLDQVRDMARQAFGEDRAPSKSSLHRYWKHLDEIAGLPLERAEEIGREVLCSSAREFARRQPSSLEAILRQAKYRRKEND